MKTSFGTMIEILDTARKSIELLQGLSVENVERTKLMLSRSARLRSDLAELEQLWTNNIKQVSD